MGEVFVHDDTDEIIMSLGARRWAVLGMPMQEVVTPDGKANPSGIVKLNRLCVLESLLCNFKLRCVVCV